MIRCRVRRGSVETARWLAAAANRPHGLKRTNADKANAVSLALAHPRGIGMSDGAIADHVGVSREMVWRYRQRVADSVPLPTTPTKRTGRDGKTYAASANRERAGQVVIRPQPGAEMKAKRGGKVAETGATPDTLDALAAPLVALRRELADLIRQTEQAGDQPGEAYFTRTRRGDVIGHLKAAAAVLEACQPYAVCRGCEGAGCDRCRQSGYLTRLLAKDQPGKLSTV